MRAVPRRKPYPRRKLSPNLIESTGPPGCSFTVRGAVYTVPPPPGVTKTLIPNQDVPPRGPG
ncbi:MAG: hypothetical protein LBR80_15045 [Deltaproteobacteria bacterium]|jgi:hypothetical protein|nr:hypothetical protein [Deltaproteobacteria bacterium]